MVLNECLRITSVSGDLALRDVESEVTKEKIEQTCEVVTSIIATRLHDFYSSNCCFGAQSRIGRRV